MDKDGGYVTREQFERLYPYGAEVRPCIVCQRWLLVASGDDKYCASHVN